MAKVLSSKPGITFPKGGSTKMYGKGTVGEVTAGQTGKASNSPTGGSAKWPQGGNTKMYSKGSSHQRVPGITGKTSQSGG